MVKEKGSSRFWKSTEIPLELKIIDNTERKQHDITEGYKYLMTFSKQGLYLTTSKITPKTGTYLWTMSPFYFPTIQFEMRYVCFIIVFPLVSATLLCICGKKGVCLYGTVTF